MCESTRKHRVLWAILTLTAALLLSACGGAANDDVKRPAYEPAASSERYASSYPQTLDALGTDLDQGETTSKASVEGMATYPDALSDPSWVRVAEIYKEADSAGRSEEMSTLIESQRTISMFTEAESDDLGRRVGRSVDEAATDSGAKNFESRRTLRPAIPRVMDQELSEHMRERHEAHLLILAHADELGDNDQTLAEQVDAITLTSHFVHVEAVKQQQALDDHLSELAGVRTTLDEGIAHYEQELGRDDLTGSQREFFQARHDAMVTARTNLDTAVQQAQTRQEKLQERVDAMQKAYDEAFANLIQDVETRAEQQQANATTE